MISRLATQSISGWWASLRPDLPGEVFASRLFRICSGVARDSGFMRCVTECTGHYSQTAAQRAGFKEVARLAYKEFRFQGRPVFADIDPPHTHLVLYEREL